MQGLENITRGNYISILQGKFVQRVQEGTEGAVTRVNKVGKTVHEKFYDRFTGLLTDIKVKDSTDYGKTWEFVFDVKGNTFILQLPYSGSFSSQFLKMLPNVDVSKPVTLTPVIKEEDGKPKSTLFVNQGDVTVKHAYTRANPNGMPELKKIMVKGQEVWDDSDVLIFLTNMVNETVLPKLGKAKIQDDAPKAVQENDVGDEKSDFDPSNIPF